MTTLCCDPLALAIGPAADLLQLHDRREVWVNYTIHEEEEEVERSALNMTVGQQQLISAAAGLSINNTSMISTSSPPPVLNTRLMAAQMKKMMMIIPAFPAAAPLMNLSMVEEGVFRSAYPDDPDRSLTFMAHALRLRSVVCLCVERPYPPSHSDFLKQHDIRLLHLGIQGTKKLQLSSDDDEDESRAAPAAMDAMRAAVEALLDERNHPVLVHCKNGKHRTGCVVGLLRKARGFPLASIFQEYRRFAGSKARASDLQLIEGFDINRLAA